MQPHQQAIMPDNFRPRSTENAGAMHLRTLTRRIAGDDELLKRFNR
jgi:hypothetical protein